MSEHEKDGGPAFACASEWGHQAGMNLRDWFAGQAMQAQVATDMVPGEACDALVEAARDAGQDPIFRLALNSYEISDAMLAARKGDPGNA